MSTDNPIDSAAEAVAFFDEDGAGGASSDGFQNLDNLANVQQWSDDEQIFFCGDDESHVEIWNELAGMETSVGLAQPPLPFPDDVALPFWWDGYEDPSAPTDFEWSGPIQPNAPPQPVEDAWPHDDSIEDWFGEFQPEDGDPLGASNSSPPFVNDEWDFSADLTEQVGSPDSYQNADVAAAPQLPLDEAWDWDVEAAVEDDGFMADVDDDFAVSPGIPGSILAVYQDEWDFSADETEQVVGVDGFQNSDGAAAPTPPLGANSDDWDDQDGEDWELIVLDDANFELDPAQPDPWDWDNDQAVEDEGWLSDVDDDFAVNPGQAAAATPSQPQDPDWADDDGEDDWTFPLPDDDFTVNPTGQVAAPQPVDVDVLDDDSTDDWQADDSAPVGAAPVVTSDQHFGDDAEQWDDSTVDVADGAQPDDYALVDPVVGASQFTDDAWDWTDDSDAEIVGLEAQTPADVLAPAAQPPDDAWSWDEDADDLWHSVNDDDFDPVPSEDRHSIENDDLGPWDDDVGDELPQDEYQQQLPPVVSAPFEDLWQDEPLDDDWTADDPLPVPLPPVGPSQFTDDGWEWPDELDNLASGDDDAILGSNRFSDGVPYCPRARDKAAQIGRKRFHRPKRF